MLFIFTLLQKVAAGTDANRAAREAYTETLSKHHNYLVKKSFDVILMAAPSTPTMLSCLGPEAVRCFLGSVCPYLPVVMGVCTRARTHTNFSKK
jgi:hypothetical protein